MSAAPSPPGRKGWLAPLALLILLQGCVSQPVPVQEAGAGHENADRLLIVDCLLPGQIRKLGRQVTYVTPRRPVKTTVSDCEIRGGEYVAFDRTNYATALKIWLPSAQEGNPAAQTYVGEIYEKGLGIEADYALAAQWYRKAAAQGYSRAQINLGYLYESGLGVPRNLAVAMDWYRKASGLSGDDLEYASSVEAAGGRTVARREKSSPEASKQLQDQLLRQQRAMAELQAQLAQTQRRFESASKELEAAQRDLKRAREELGRSRKASQADQNTQKIELLLAKMTKLEQEMQEQKNSLKLVQEASRKGEDLIPRKERDAGTKAGPAVVQTTALGPTIEIIEPPLSITRGIPSIELRSRISRLEIIGRVTAPAKLLSFRINDRVETPDASGLFQATIPIEAAETPVNMVAVDKNGKRSAVSFMLTSARAQPPAKKKADSTAAGRPGASPGVDFGNYYALVIGNDEYANLPDLKTARNDARAVGDILRTKYGFKTRVLTDADRYSILSALNELRESLTEQDNLLIYYAGHGELDKTNLRGYWLPVDAEPENTANWISNVAITDILNVMSARHIMVVADSCYSGTLTRSSLARLRSGMSGEKRRRWYQAMTRTKTRVVLTSGGEQPVLDAGGGEHSVFARAFLEVLRENDQILEGYRLYREVQQRVKRAASLYRIDQDPQYAPIKYAGHEAGEFFFLPEKTASTGRPRIALALSSQDGGD